VAQRVVALTRGRYAGENQQHPAELLEEEQQIYLPRSMMRRVLLLTGIRTPRTPRAAKHRSRRGRKPGRGCCAGGRRST